jgi:hypothetical protein
MTTQAQPLRQSSDTCRGDFLFIAQVEAVQFPPKGSFDEVIMSFIVDFPLFFFFCSD